MPSNHNILTWKYCHNILLEHSFAAPSDIPPRPAHIFHHWVIHQRGKQKPRVHHWIDCRIGKIGARTAVSRRYTLLPTPGEQQAQGTRVSQHTAAVCCWCHHHWPGGDTSALLSQWFHRELKPTRHPQSCALLLLPKESYRTATKG